MSSPALPQASWLEEKRSAELYRILAQIEPDPRKRAMFGKLAEAAEEQGSIWAARVVNETGKTVGPYRLGWRGKVVATCLRLLGPARTRGLLAALKVRGLSVYRGPPALPEHPQLNTVEDVWRAHGGTGRGGNLRAAVFGMNDGLISNVSLILGVAGATADPEVLLISGIAGLLAGAFSMAAGEYVSVRSQREFYEKQIAIEREELALYPEEEAKELALIYNARGLPMDEAHSVALKLVRDPASALDILAREELGLNPDDLGSPWGAAISSFLAFACGAIVPLLPFLLRLAEHAVQVSLGLSGAALLAVGAALSLFTGRNVVVSALRMLLIGAGAGGVTYLIGWLVGTTVA